MNLQITMPLIVKPNVQDTKFLPKDVSTKQWYNVIGFEYYRKKFFDKNEKDSQGNFMEKWTTVINFLIINDKLKLTSIASFNCDVSEFKQKKDAE